MQILPETVGIGTHVGLPIVIDDDYPKIPGTVKEGLNDKGIGDQSEHSLVVDLFNRGKEQNAQTAVFPLEFEDNPADSGPAIMLDSLDQVMDGVDYR